MLPHDRIIAAGFRVFQVLLWAGVLLAANVTALTAALILFKAGLLTSADPHSPEIIAGYHRFNTLVLGIHILTALPPLVIGPWNFVRRILQTRLHRWMGWVYVSGIFASGVTGFVLAAANRHFAAKFGFGILAVVWLLTTFMALETAREQRFKAHRKWMVRSYMLTLAVVTVRMVPTPAMFTDEQWYPILSWACWVPNLILAELYLQITNFKGRLKSSTTSR